MLSIGAMGADQGNYYLELAREDYYLEGGEPPGKWLGRGAKILGLTGTVTKEVLRNLLLGEAPDGNRPLIQNAGEENHQPGWDLTFSAPKSVSALWAVADSELRQAIQDAHQQAVIKAVEYLQAEATFTRRGKAGRDREPAQLIVATFEHGTSRTMDPQLHTHALVLNVAIRHDGTSGTIESKPLYEHKMAAGALYRAELAAQLEQKPGLECERQSRWFEVKGVPKNLMTEFSKRRTEIETFLKRGGLTSASASSYAALATREKKDHAVRSELHPKWQEISRSYGFTQVKTRSLLKSPPHRNFDLHKQEAIQSALEHILNQSSYFSKRDLLRCTAEEAQTTGIGADHIRAVVDTTLSTSKDIVSLGRYKGEVYYTTRGMLEIERRLLNEVKAGKNDSSHAIEAKVVNSKLARNATLSEEQRTAISHITARKGNIQVVSGMAGTGKTQMLAVARQIWEEEGYRILGGALAGKAAQGLQEGAGIPSETLHKTLLNIKSGFLTLDARTILVVDEAGMVSTKQMASVVSEVQKKGGKVILVGDAKQLQPVEAGGAFQEIGKIVGEATLTTIRRQREEWSRQAVHDFASGNAHLALKAYAKKGLLTITEDRPAAIQAIVSDWKADKTALQDKIVLAGTNAEARIINKSIQAERHDKGDLGRLHVEVNGEILHECDRVLFTQNSRLYGVKNGSLGTIESISQEEDTLGVKLDNGDRRTISLRHYQHLRLGYAVTTHKAQGITTEKAYVLTGGAMQDRELAYVQASRTRGQTHLYTDCVEAGEAITQLAQQMKQSHQKRLASSIQEAAMETNTLRYNDPKL